MNQADLIIKNAHILTVSAQGEIANGCIIVKDEKIIDVFEGPLRDYRSDEMIDAKGKLVIPGFVDCHTHLVHAGSRANELQYRLQSMSYQEIQKRGGGIYASVRDTRAASPDDLFQQSLERAKLCLKHGTTTAEIKTGYGLNPATEKKMFDKVETERVLDCMECGSCSYICPSNRPILDYIRLGKSTVNKIIRTRN